jgi:hypothetical protein
MVGEVLPLPSAETDRRSREREDHDRDDRARRVLFDVLRKK